MIPKVGDIVRISEEFVNEFNCLSPSGELYYDVLKQWINRYQRKNLKVSNLSLSIYGCFVVTIETPDQNFILDKNGRLEGWQRKITIPFFTYAENLEEVQSNTYCSCSSPKLKDVFISPSLQYKFCQVCKKEYK